MKKGFKFGLICLAALGLGGIAIAPSFAPTTAIVAHADFEEKSYTYSDDNGSSTITLTSETECTITLQETGSEEIQTTNGVYVRDGNVITLIVGGNQMKVVVNDDDMTFGEYVEPVVVANKVIIDETKHAKVTTSILEGEVGDICVVTIKNDMFYIVDAITVNGVALVESETTYGEYSFALVEGENHLIVTMKIDEEAVGVFYDSIKAIENKDWSYLFSVQNIMAILGWLLNGTCLIAMVRYFVKDKKLAGKVEAATKEAITKIVPDQTKEAVLSTVEGTITPIFAQLTSDNAELKKALNTFAQCMALAQENTPESRIAIVNALSGLNLGEEADLYARVMEYIDKMWKEHEKTLNDAMEALKAISEKSAEIIEEDNALVTEEPKDEEVDGRQF